MVIGQNAQTIQNESLSKLLNQTDVSNLTSEQKQQLKVAFAEGYLAANSPENAKKNSRAMKFLKVKACHQTICDHISHSFPILGFPTAPGNSRVHGHLLQPLRIQQRLGVQVNKLQVFKSLDTILF